MEFIKLLLHLESMEKLKQILYGGFATSVSFVPLSSESLRVTQTLSHPRNLTY